MSFNVPANQPCTSSLAHWQGINLVDGDMDEKKRNRRAGEKGRGSVVLETLNRKRDGLMNEGKKLQNVGQWQQEAVASEHCLLHFGALIASMRLLACLSVSQKGSVCMSGMAGDPVEGFQFHGCSIQLSVFNSFQTSSINSNTFSM